MLLNIDNELNIIKNSKFIVSGGIGMILNNESYIYKILFFKMAYLNNIKMYNNFHDKISMPNLVNYFVYSDIYIKSNEEIKQKLDDIYQDKLYLLYQKNQKNIILENNYLILYVLKYEKLDNNCYYTFLNQINTNDRSLNETFSFFIIWIFNLIHYMNIGLKVYHNDLKLDNILIKKKLKNVVTKYKFNNIILYNHTNYDFYLNDFDMTLDNAISQNLDLINIKTSINKIFANKNQTNFIEYILNKINTIETESDIFPKWLDRSTLFKQIITNNIIDEFLSFVNKIV